MQSATIRLVGACGLTTTLQQIRVADQDARDALRDGWNLHAATSATPRPLLQPDTDYTITVAMSWAGWRPASPGQQPPATVADASWAPLDDVVLTFHTAALEVDASSSLPQVPLTGETAFDPRSVARYLIGFDPAGPGAPPHLLDDALLVHFSVDHAEQLVAAYGHTLTLALRRTDPPPGSVVDGPLTPVALDIDRVALASNLMDPVDRRVIDAVRADPRCLSTEVNTGGVTLAATGDLEPDAEYDLLLHAVPDAGGAALLVARSHFRSSRHADVQALLASLGFATPGPALFVPADFVAAAGTTMPPADPLASDAVLEDALRTLGLDPWPLVPQGRTVAIWLPGAAAGSWQLGGLLLESPEPLQRGSRCSVAQAQVLRDGSTLATYVPLRANTAGTRVLLAIAGDADGRKFAGDDLVLQLQMHDRQVLRSASRVLRALPRVAYQELP
jgi:hypothetical protein